MMMMMMIKNGGNAKPKYTCPGAKVAILSLDFPYSGLMIYSGEILTTGKFTRRSFAFLLMKEKYLIQYRLDCQEYVSLQFIYLFRRINSQSV